MKWFKRKKKQEEYLEEDVLIPEAYTVDELCEKIYAGEIQDSKTVAAILAYKNKYVQ